MHLSNHHSLQAGDVALLGRHLEVAVDDTAIVSVRPAIRGGAYVTASKMLVPLPRAPMRSLETDRRQMMAPPNAAAVGMTRFSSRYMLWSRWPAMTRPC